MLGMIGIGFGIETLKLGNSVLTALIDSIKAIFVEIFNQMKAFVVEIMWMKDIHNVFKIVVDLDTAQVKH